MTRFNLTARPARITRWLAATLGCLALTQAVADPTEDDFQKVSIATGLDQPMQFEISEDGRIFVIGRCGAFYGWDLDNGTPTQTGTLTQAACNKNNNDEHGLLSLALDPNFTENSYIYLQYTPFDQETRVSRFTVLGDNSLDLASEAVLLSWPSDDGGHMGGTMLFDSTGNLIITTGDNRSPSGYFSQGAEETSGNTNDLRGKVLRITPTAEGGYTIPAGNLFEADAQHKAEIYAMGFRNPFRASIDPETDTVYLGDIGPDANADSAEGPRGLDELNAISEAGHFGWPHIIGFNQSYEDPDNPGTYFDPAGPLNDDPDNTGVTTLPATTPALWSVLHRATMAGPVYRFNGGVEGEFKLPEFYDGHLIFWDFNSSNFFTIDLADADEPPIETEFPIDTNGIFGAIDAELDPRTHQLYVLHYGAGCCNHNPGVVGSLSLYRYIGDADVGTNIALSGVASATSELGGNTAAAAIDGDPTTRWESAFEDPQTLTIDLQQAAVLDTIVIDWEAAYSSAFTVEGSVDGITWEVLITETNGTGGRQLYFVESETAFQYLRLTGTARGSDYGHSIFEFEVYAVEEAGEPEPLPELAYLNMPHELDNDFTGVPLLLSETGVFTDTANLVPAAHLIPFEPNAKLWSDRAVKSRWLSLPSGGRIDWSATENWTYPEGTVAVKHFELPVDEANPAETKRLETRLLVMQGNGRVYGVTYQWRADNSDADLLTTEVSEDITIADGAGGTWTQTWAYPSPTQCLDCHNSASSQILGLSTRQLNGDYDYPGGTENQLVHWNTLGAFSPTFVNEQVDMMDKAADLDDSTASVETRVKSYLDANCAHCHGVGQGGSEWDARFNTPLNEMRIVDQLTTGIRDYEADYGLLDAKVIRPGAPEDSVLYIRDKSTDPEDRMPPLGRALEHTEYIALLDEWISDMSIYAPLPDDTPPSEGGVVTSSDDSPTAGNVTDGDAESIWLSDLTNSPWVQIDLGDDYWVEEILVSWGSQYGQEYVIDGSLDGVTWTTLVVQDSGNGGLETFEGLAGAYRYIRLTGASNAAQYSLAIAELQVYGSEAPVSLNKTVTTSTPEGAEVTALAVDGDNTTLWTSDFMDEQWIEIDLEGTYTLSRITLDWEAYYKAGYDIEGSLDRATWTTLVTQTSGQGCFEEYDVTGSYRYVRLTRAASAADWGYGLWEFAIYGEPVVVEEPEPEPDPDPVPTGDMVPAQLTPVNAAASTFSQGDRSPAAATDGDAATRWESSFGEDIADPDDQYIQLDLGENTYVTRVVLTWEAAYGEAYEIQLSEDGIAWETVYSTDTGDGGIDDITLNGQLGRYVRMQGIARATGYGYSLFEFEAYGLAASENPPLIDIVAPTEGQTFADTTAVELSVTLSDADWFTNGGSYRYRLDGGEAVTVANLTPINLGMLTTGAHELDVELLNADSQPISIPRHINFTVNCGNDCPNVLVFSKTAGFRHDSIADGIAMVQAMADDYGYNVTATEDETLFTTENLAQYTTVVFMNTTGDVFNADQETAFRNYIENGGGFVGTHAAADTEHDWDWYTDTLLGGAEFDHHGDGIPEARIVIEQPSHELVNHIGTEMTFADEWYFFLTNPRNREFVTVLGTLDRSSYASNYPVEDHPVIFTNAVGDGRAFYTAIGHVGGNFSNEDVSEMIRKAIDWTSGD